jgi:hypothetical protein
MLAWKDTKITIGPEGTYDSAQDLPTFLFAPQQIVC